jgi:ActR/RegA family two-component response regulator
MSFLKNLFEPKTKKTGIIFIVEDNTAYAKTLAAFIKATFAEIKEIKIFPVGETCVTELDMHPDLIIMDYFLDSKYTDAETGLEIIKQIRAEHPEMNILLLSGQKDMGVALETVRTYKCSYVQKNEEAFERVEEIIKEIV